MLDTPVFTVINTLVKSLIEAEDRRLGMILSKLNQRNKQLHNTKVDGFLHAGQFYLPKDASLRTMGAKTPLHPSLYQEIFEFTHDREIVQTDMTIIRQALHVLLSPCKSDQAIRDALPECLVPCIPAMLHRSRDRETAFTIQDNPRYLRQFEAALLKMEFYAAAKLFY